MEIINRQRRMASLSRQLRREEKTIGFVPTMGAIHEGHLSLIRKAQQMCDTVVVSVFVNPTQFNENKDFESYPRDLTSDASILAEYNVDYVFAPDADEIYGDSFSTFVMVDDISEQLEGASRPGHFRGVATVVTILLNTVRPDFAFFGQKDAQQVAIVKRLVDDLFLETEVVVIPIVREDSGLAISSRNQLLSDEEHGAASVIFSALTKASEKVGDGERNAAELAEITRKTIESQPLARIDYIALVDPDTLEPVERIADDPVLLCVAVRFGSVRLIDNVILSTGQQIGQD